jgi:hypothetical protein
MEIRKILSSKSMKLLTLLLISMLIFTASATVYNYMYMQASPISPATAKVQFVSAADSTAAGATVSTDGTYVSFNALSGWPNATRTYQAACGIQNLDTSARTIQLAFAQAGDWSGSTADITSMTVIVRSTAGGAQQGTTITVGSAGSSTGSVSITGTTTWVVEWNITWKSAAPLTDKVTVKLTMTVTGS